MKIILTTILLMSAIWSQAQVATKYDLKQDVRIANLEKWHKMDSLNIAWLKKGKTTDSIRINTLITQNTSQSSQIASLLSLTATQANDISSLQTKTNLQGLQIRALQDSLADIPFVLVDTLVVPGKQNLTFRKNILSVTK